MPIAQLITSGIELAMNQLLKVDDDSQVRLRKLAGKSLQVTVRELPWPLLFSFSEQIDVRAVLSSPDEVAPNTAPVDCLIELNLETLPKLKDSSQLTRLIQDKQLNLMGDIYVAQTFSALLKDVDIDWEEQLSGYTGDVVAHQTFSSFRTLFDTAKRQLEQGAAELGQRLTQSDSIAVKPSEIQDFGADVSDLRSDTERLSARVARLEHATKADTGPKN